MQLVLCAKYGCMCCYAHRGVEVCVGMNQVEVMVINVVLRAGLNHE